MHLDPPSLRNTAKSVHSAIGSGLAIAVGLARPRVRDFPLKEGVALVEALVLSPAAAHMFRLVAENLGWLFQPTVVALVALSFWTVFSLTVACGERDHAGSQDHQQTL
jgi:hypothetical protein